MSNDNSVGRKGPPRRKARQGPANLAAARGGGTVIGTRRTETGIRRKPRSNGHGGDLPARLLMVMGNVPESAQALAELVGANVFQVRRALASLREQRKVEMVRVGNNSAWSKR